ncbi:MAG: methyltransferase domain-containing protein [Propionibacteriaceae bacterium]
MQPKVQDPYNAAPRLADARVADVRRLFDDPDLAASSGIDAEDASTVDGYRRWSMSYDVRRNGLYPLEEPWVRDRVDRLLIGTALDAACGTDRHGAYLAERGHRVIGLDSSADMLAQAERKAPSGASRSHVTDDRSRENLQDPAPAPLDGG